MNLPSSWTTERFGSLARISHGWPFKSAEFTTDPKHPVVVSIGNFHYTGGMRFASSKLKHYRGDYPEQYRLAPGDLIVIMTCQTEGGEILGVPGVVPDDDRTYLHNQRIGRIVDLDATRVTPNFLFHWARTGLFNKQLVATASGSKILHTSPSRIEDTFVHLPPLPEQQAIAEVLGALDDKIAANTRVAAGAEALFSAQFAALIESTTPVPLSEFADFVNGKAFTKNASGTGRVVIRIAELNSGLGGSTVYNDIEVDEKHVAHPGDMLFAWSGSLTIHRWFRDEAIVNQHIFKVIPKTGVPSWLVWGLLERKIEEFRAIAADKATTMGHIQRRHLDEPVLAPTDQAVSDADASMSALWDAAHTARQENERLAATRDALLPALMSGRLRVEEAEETVDSLS